MNLIANTDYRNEMAQQRSNARTNADVGRAARQIINSTVAGLRTELMAMSSGLSLDVIDEFERQVIGCFGPEGAYRDFVSDITADLIPGEVAEAPQQVRDLEAPSLLNAAE